MNLLALEASTSSAKAMLYDARLGTFQTVSEAYDSSICGEGLTDTEQVFQCVARLGRQLARGKEIAAVAVGSTWHSVAICDPDMHPLTRTHNWNYMEPSEMCRRARSDRALASELYSRTGCMPHVTYARDMLRYRCEEGMDLKGKLLPSQGAYNFFRLTGAFCETRCNASGMGILNLKSLEYDDFAAAYSGVACKQFGRLCDYRDALPLTRDGAALLGVDVGIPVVPAHADGALNQLGDGAAKRGQMTISVGTSGAVRLTTAQPSLPESHALWCYRGAVDYMSGAATAGACNCINWYKDCCIQGLFSFERLEDGAALPDDSPVFLPFLFGERCPGWRDDRLGGFVEVRPEHTMADLYLAVQRGVLFNLYQCYEELVRCMGSEDRICLSGGILNSERWCQMAADIFGREMEISRNRDASLMGGVVLGMHAAGLVDDVAAYQFPSAQSRKKVLPRAERTKVLRRQYEKYLEWYGRSASDQS